MLETLINKHNQAIEELLEGYVNRQDYLDYIFDLQYDIKNIS